jgi:dipeptide/tripeptide permease
MDKALRDYAELLRIRHAAERRNTAITRWAFLLSIIGYIALGMLGVLQGISLFLTSIFPIAFGAGFLAAWAKSHTTSEIMQLVDTLRRTGEGG